MVTARLAAGYDRDVLAVPGRATDEFSRGTNALIFNRVAQPVMSARDIVRELMWDTGTVASAPRHDSGAGLTGEQRALLGLFDGDPLTADVLQTRSGLAPGALARLLMDMELSGVLRRVNGNRYEKMI